MSVSREVEGAITNEGGSEDPVSVLQTVYPSLARAAKGLCQTGDELDLVHDALIEVLVRYPDFRGLHHPKAYSLVVLTRLAYARRARRVREGSVPGDVADLLESPQSHDEISTAVDRVAISRALMTLGSRQRTCIHLRFIVGMDDTMIGEVLGCSRVTVRTQIARGLRKLRSVLQEGSQDGGSS